MPDEFSNAGMGTTEAEVFDFTNDGLPVGKDHAWTITEATENEKENGKQWVLKLESETVPVAVYVREWISHTNETAQRIGRGNLKKIFIGVLGQPKGSLAQLRGAKVTARLSEDKEGFARLSAYKPTPKAVAPVGI